MYENIKRWKITLTKTATPHNKTFFIWVDVIQIATENT